MAQEILQTLQTLYEQPLSPSAQSPLARVFARRGRQLRIALFGCTGSIGRNTVDVVRANPERLKIVALAAGSNEDALLTLAKDLGVDRLAISSGSGKCSSGDGALRRLAAEDGIDVVVNAVVGAAGLEVTLGALDAGHDIALANKESLVMAGELVMRRIEENRSSLRPIDSEHAALVSCLRGRPLASIDRLYLTASGGPFRGRKAGTFDDVTVEEALNHPTWSMGPKITIDSATLMNKGLEIIEAHHLFNVSQDRIDVVVHPQSIIHAMIRHHDGSVIAELAPPDMRLPIQRSLLSDGEFSSPLDPLSLPTLTFEKPDLEAFPALELAREALRRGGTAAAVLNAANEAAVGAFLEKSIRFGAITDIIRRTLDAHSVRKLDSEEAVYEADRWGREQASGIVKSLVQDGRR
jgi:1-deoxy-D-xylulose-5-phosphate reductoisomerase